MSVGCEEREIFKSRSHCLGVMEFSVGRKGESHGGGGGSDSNIHPNEPNRSPGSQGPGGPRDSVSRENAPLT